MEAGLTQGIRSTCNYANENKASSSSFIIIIIIIIIIM